ncbi:MAG: hypothetical protein PHE55_01820 [Methylococcaceae bacterium]|nr:hypothetical protein [Methylococcaceae bacterium]
MKNDEMASYAAFEEVMRRAMDEGVVLFAKPSLSDEDRGALMAYINILDWGKQQADIFGIEIGDQELKNFDPYSLIPRKAA